MKSFIERLRQIAPLSDGIVSALTSLMEEIRVPRGGHPVTEGMREPYVRFVKEGLIRAYVERDGKDVTLWFARDGEIVNFVYRDRAVYNVEAVEETTLLLIPHARFESLCRESLELSNWLRAVMEIYMREYEDYFINDSWGDARQQYEALLRDNPELFRRLPLKHIASYLRITPQSLSRIRARKK